MRKWLILLFALPAATASSAPAWTWVDANGTVHFSDRPVPGARQIELASAQSFGGTVPTPTGASAAAPNPTAPAYESIEIVSPSDQETLWNIGGTLNVVVQFQPPLQPGHRFDVAIDGQRRNLNTASPRTTVSDVFRGAHALQIVVIDTAGTEVMRSQPRSFFVQQTSIQSPTNPRNNASPPPNPNPPG
ncbi:MAG TPA: DUF4124 domain-containing protein [Gammaproteobacteria bacterium]|nr:DUF4124 domain-containing protein [Gammaproteobacteria bacterium]